MLHLDNNLLLDRIVILEDLSRSNEFFRMFLAGFWNIQLLATKRTFCKDQNKWYLNDDVNSWWILNIRVKVIFCLFLPSKYKNVKYFLLKNDIFIKQAIIACIHNSGRAKMRKLQTVQSLH